MSRIVGVAGVGTELRPTWAAVQGRRERERAEPGALASGFVGPSGGFTDPFPIG